MQIIIIITSTIYNWCRNTAMPLQGRLIVNSSTQNQLYRESKTGEKQQKTALALYPPISHKRRSSNLGQIRSCLQDSMGLILVRGSYYVINLIKSFAHNCSLIQRYHSKVAT